MSAAMATGGLSLDQAPPLSIPASFFLCIPLALILAGVILLGGGISALTSPWLPRTLALTHIGTLGVLAMGMLGALYQMTPVVAGATVPYTRLAHLVQLLLLAALAGFVWRLLGGPLVAMRFAIFAFQLALPLFLLPLGWALLRPATHNHTVQGMRIALVSLAIISLMGLSMAAGYAGENFGEQRALWIKVHLALALLGWVGGLIMAVSWQVIPMFYLAPTTEKSTTRLLLASLVAGLTLPLISLFAGPTIAAAPDVSVLISVSLLPAVLVIWLVHPIMTLRGIARRKRKRSDASLSFWYAGLITAMLLVPLAIALSLSADPRLSLLFGWLAIWGWAGMIMHGMLSRIVPFLVWFHRYSAKVGLQAVPSMRSLLSQVRIQTGFALHLGSVLSGVLAIITQQDYLARVTGILLIATAINLAAMLIHVLKHR
jgi:hypothetical protein